jgi:hypothetical protein
MLALPFIIYTKLTRNLQCKLFLNYKPLRINPMFLLLCLISYVLYKITITLCFEGLLSMLESTL